MSVKSYFLNEHSSIQKLLVSPKRNKMSSEVWSESGRMPVINFNDNIGEQLIKLYDCTWRGMIKKGTHRAWKWQQVVI